MEKMMKIGNLTVYRESGTGFPGDLFFDGPTVTLYAINGTDIVRCETYLQVADEQFALDRFMELFDTYTLPMISAALPEITSEYDGALLSGKIAGFSSIEYFKRIDDTRFYKHFTHRPAMPAETS